MRWMTIALTIDVPSLQQLQRTLQLEDDGVALRGNVGKLCLGNEKRAFEDEADARAEQFASHYELDRKRRSANRRCPAEVIHQRLFQNILRKNRKAELSAQQLGER